jgi:hypothetical protein
MISRLDLSATSTLVFAPLAWLKLQYLCHSGCTEVGGFGISDAADLLRVVDFGPLRQRTCPVSVAFDDDVVANYVDACVDAGLPQDRFFRLWIHTHPGSSVQPSATDEQTFARVFSASPWGVMFILGRTGQTLARLSFAAGPGASLLLPVAVDWAAWADLLQDPAFSLAALASQFAATINPVPGADLLPFPPPLLTDGFWADRWPPRAPAIDDEDFPIPHPEEDDFDERSRRFDPGT